MDNEKDEPISYGVRNLAIWDHLVILIAAVLSICGLAVFFNPSLGTAITRVLDAPAPPPVQAVQEAAPQTPGIVETFIVPPTPPAAATKKK